jgi:hypothetical protein
MKSRRKPMANCRFEKGVKVGGELTLEMMRCLDCGRPSLVIGARVGGRENHFPLSPDDATQLAAWLSQFVVIDQGLRAEGEKENRPEHQA